MDLFNLFYSTVLLLYCFSILLFFYDIILLLYYSSMVLFFYNIKKIVDKQFLRHKIYNMGKTALRQYLDLTGLTYREAARRTGLTHQSVFVHARGKSPIGAASALIYHKVFGISLEKLLADRAMPRPKR